MTNHQPVVVGIDLGSNSFRLLAASVKLGEITVLKKELVTVRLAHGLAETKLLDPEAINRGLHALKIFRSSIASLAPYSIRACATQALRMTENRDEFLTPAADILGVEIDVISGSKEAQFTLAGVLSALPLQSGPFCVVDVGGGSTEIIFRGPGPHQVLFKSLPYGVVGLTESYFHGSPIPLLSLEAGREFLRNILAPEIPSSDQCVMIGSGGTATALAALALELDHYDGDFIQGYSLKKEKLSQIIDRLCSLSVQARNQLPGLDLGRGDIIIAGAQIFNTLLELTGADQLLVSDAGLLEGIVLSKKR